MVVAEPFQSAPGGATGAIPRATAPTPPTSPAPTTQRTHVPVAGDTLTAEQIFSLALRQWGDPEIAVTMTAIALAESTGKTTANPQDRGVDENSRGLWQINVRAHSATLAKHGYTQEDLYDPEVNAYMAYIVGSHNGGVDLSRWSVTHSGNGTPYRRYETIAKEAAAALGYEGLTGDFGGRRSYNDRRQFGTQQASAAPPPPPGTDGNQTGFDDDPTTDPLSELTEEEALGVVASDLPFMLTFINIPELRDIFIRAAREGWSADAGRIQAELIKTEWWQSRSENQRLLAGLKATDPAEYNRKVIETAKELRSIYIELGFKPPEGDPFGGMASGTPLYDQAEAYLLTGIQGAELSEMIQREVVNGAPFDPNNATPSGSLSTSMNAIQTIARQNMVTVTDGQAYEWAQKIAAGDLTTDAISDLLRDQALSKFSYDPTLVEQIRSGFSPEQLFSEHRAVIARTLGLDPDTIDLDGDSFYSPVLRTGDKAMTVAEVEKWVRGTDRGSRSRTVQRDGAQVLVGLMEAFGIRG